MSHYQTSRQILVPLTVCTLFACAEQPSDNGTETVMWMEDAVHEWSLGALEEPSAEVFGQIRAVAVRASGEVLILDASTMEVTSVNANGAVQAVFGGRGEGPGELSDPVTLLAHPTDSLIIVDREKAVFQWFALDESPHEVFRSQLPFRPADACVTRNRVFLLGYHESLAVHEIDPRTGLPIQGFVDSSVGEMMLDQSAVGMTLAAEAASGTLACTSNGQVVHAPERLGWIRSYDLDGGLEWEVRLPGFAEPQRTSTASGGVRYDVDERFGYVNRISAVTLVRDTVLLVRVETVFPRIAGRPPEEETLLLGVSDGEELGRFVTPDIAVDARGRYVVSTVAEPFPAVSLWSSPVTEKR